jgi:hypothetical protein
LLAGVPDLRFLDRTVPQKVDVALIREAAKQIDMAVYMLTDNAGIQARGVHGCTARIARCA